MRKQIDISKWDRRNALAYFDNFSNPFIHVGASVDCHGVKEKCKETGDRFNWVYLHAVLTATNAQEGMRYRSPKKGELYLYDTIDALAILSYRDKERLEMVRVPFYADFADFKGAVEGVLNGTTDRETYRRLCSNHDDDILMVSAMPFFDFTSITPAQQHERGSSYPLFTSGKVTANAQGRDSFTGSLSVHHAFMDGYHVSLFFEDLKNYFARYVNA